MGSFNSLSRDHDILVKGGEDNVPLVAFNSLSRDHRRVTKVPSIYVIAFNSLSRDHKKITTRRLRQILEELAFNSLSRDHRARFRDFPSLRGVLPRRPFAQMNFVTTI